MRPPSLPRYAAHSSPASNWRAPPSAAVRRRHQGRHPRAQPEGGQCAPARTGALALSALGIYLLAVSVSTTGEDLLLGHTTSIAQLGVQVAPEVSFGIAPLVFVAVHVFTLIRYDLLAVNLRSFRSELDATVPLAADRERCRQLLSKVEFVVALAVPSDSSLYSRLFNWVARAIIAVFPVVVLLAMKISELRYQNVWLNQVQRAALLIDLLMLVWFFSPKRRSSGLAVRVGWQRLALLGATVSDNGACVPHSYYGGGCTLAERPRTKRDNSSRGL
jgi:hypothetical protein